MPADKSNEIRLIRVYDAPLKAVWDAWTDPEQVAQWWGPRGFTISTHHKDLRPGGTWVYTMHGPDGVDYPNSTLYHEVQKHAKLVYDHGGSEGRPPLFRVTVLFAALPDGKTQMDMTMSLATPEAAAETRKVIKKHGGNSTWDRLAEFLEKEASGKERFVIARAFDAPQAMLFDLWAQPEHLARWLPPTGFNMQFLNADIRPGGRSTYVMFNGPTPGESAVKMFGCCTYHQIDRPTTLVYDQQFCDEQGRITRHPHAPTWPASMRTTVTFAAEGPGVTRVTVAWEPGEGATPEEIKTFVEARGGMTQGWTGSFDKLESLLAAG